MMDVLLAFIFTFLVLLMLYILVREDLMTRLGYWLLEHFPRLRRFT